MNMKRVSLGGLVVTLLCLGVVRAEDMPAPPTARAGRRCPAPAAMRRRRRTRSGPAAPTRQPSS